MMFYGECLALHRSTTGTPMSTMNSEVYDALIDAGADEAKARKAAKSVVQPRHRRRRDQGEPPLAQVDGRLHPGIRRRAHLAGVPVADARRRLLAHRSPRPEESHRRRAHTVPRPAPGQHAAQARRLGGPRRAHAGRRAGRGGRGAGWRDPRRSDEGGGTHRAAPPGRHGAGARGGGGLLLGPGDSGTRTGGTRRFGEHAGARRCSVPPRATESVNGSWIPARHQRIQGGAGGAMVGTARPRHLPVNESAEGWATHASPLPQASPPSLPASHQRM